MEDAAQVLAHFLNAIANLEHHHYGREYLAEILKPVLVLEASVRHCFLTGKPCHTASIDPHIGLFDVFVLPREVRRAQAREGMTPVITHYDLRVAKSTLENDARHFSYYSEAARVLCSFPRTDIFPLSRELFRRTGTPCMVESLVDFRQNLAIYTHGALDGITNWQNIVITGGTVVACLSGRTPSPYINYTKADINEFFHADDYYAQSPVDIMLYGLTPEQAIAKTEEIFQAISSSALWKLTVVRKVDSISIHTLYPCRPIIIHLNIYVSPGDLLANCDVDCSCCLYDGSTVYMSPRGLVSFMRQTNTINLSLWSPSYETRLAKYAKRGFEVHAPFLERERVAYNRLYDRDLDQLPVCSLGRLLVLELLNQVPDHLHTLNKLSEEVFKSSTLGLLACKLYAPIDKQAQRDLDIFWIHTPYGPQWDDMAIQSTIETMDKGMNNPEHHNRRHYHPAFASNELSDCLKPVCDTCPDITEDDKYEMDSDGVPYLHGPLRFYPNVDNLKKKFFLLLGNEEGERLSRWTAGAYLHEHEMPSQASFQVIPCRLWRNWTLGVTVGSDLFLEVDRAFVTDLLPSQVSSALDHLIKGDRDSSRSDMDVSGESDDGSSESNVFVSDSDLN